MKNKVHIITCISYDTTLLRHFLDYYHSLGISSFYIAIDERVAGIWAETEHIISSFPALDINLVEASERHRTTGLEANNKEETRKGHLPERDWLIPVDLDELIQFPASISTLIEEMEKTQTTFIMGRFVDRISRNGMLSLTLQEVSLWEQYPLECDISKMLVKCWSHKVILCRGDCELSSGHHNVIRPARPLVTRRGTIHHFKWRAGILEALQRRVDIYIKARFNAYKESQRVIDYLQVNDRFIPEDFNAQEGWKPISDPRLGSHIIYTAISKNYDILKCHDLNLTSGSNFVAFVDVPDRAEGCVQLPLNNDHEDPCRNAKIHKILPHKYFPNAEFSLWIDGSIHLKADFNLDHLIETFLANTDIAVFSHASRKCIYSEGAACFLNGKDEANVILTQMTRYRYESYPEQRGLVECPIILRRHTEGVRKFNDVWWDEICHHSRRDQLSFNYVAWKLGMKYSTFPGTIHRNPFFKKRPHSFEANSRDVASALLE